MRELEWLWEWEWGGLFGKLYLHGKHYFKTCLTATHLSAAPLEVRFFLGGVLFSHLVAAAHDEEQSASRTGIGFVTGVLLSDRPPLSRSELNYIRHDRKDFPRVGTHFPGLTTCAAFSAHDNNDSGKRNVFTSSLHCFQISLLNR